MFRNPSGGKRPILIAVALIPLFFGACKPREGGEKPTESADEFVARINKEMAELQRESSAAGWVQATYINDDTEMLNAKANERFLTYFNKAVEESKRYAGESLKPETARAIFHAISWL